MSREIKFNIWDNGVMDYNYDIEDIIDFQMNIDFNNCVFLQYTGLKDKNGVEIYEGDVIEWGDGTTETCEMTEIWKSIGMLEDRGEYDYEIEVIGNIYENTWRVNDGNESS